jgi:hypothetical protein
VERDQRSQLMNVMPGAKANAAPTAGRGLGNIPGAPGMLSGRFSPQQRPVPRGGDPPMAMDGSDIGGGGGGPPGGEMGGMGGGMPEGTPGGVPLGPGQMQPMLDPQFLFDFHATLMTALIEAASSDQGIY